MKFLDKMIHALQDGEKKEEKKEAPQPSPEQKAEAKKLIKTYLETVLEISPAISERAMSQAEDGNWIHLGVIITLIEKNLQSTISGVARTTVDFFTEHLLAEGVSPEAIMRASHRALTSGRLPSKGDLPAFTSWTHSATEKSPN